MTTSLKAQAVCVEPLDASVVIEGEVIDGIRMQADPPRFDLDAPFLVQTEEGPVWVRLPWACTIEVL